MVNEATWGFSQVISQAGIVSPQPPGSAPMALLLLTPAGAAVLGGGEGGGGLLVEGVDEPGVARCPPTRDSEVREAVGAFAALRGVGCADGQRLCGG